MRLAIVIIGFFVLLLGLAIGLGFYFGGKTQSKTTVQIEQAIAGELVQTINAPGEIEAKTMVNISAKTAAQIVELPFEEGEQVYDGIDDGDITEASVLVRLDDSDAQARLRQAKANRAAQASQLAVAEARIVAGEARLAANKALLTEAEKNLERQIDLFESQDVSQRVVEQARAQAEQLRATVSGEGLSIKADQANLDVIRFQIEAADAEIERAEEELTYTVIRSPIDGIVTKVNAEVGEIVITGTMNNPGTVIMEVADLSEMIVEAQVDENSITDVEVGQTAIIRATAYGETQIPGVVRSVALADTVATSGESAGSKYYVAEVVLDPDKTSDVRIFSGLTADVDIETRTFEDVIRVPSQAVLGRRVDGLPQELRKHENVRTEKQFTPVVYRLVDGKAVVTPVQVGASDLQRTVIEAGLEAGETIIVGPYKVLETLQHDTAVQSEEEAEAAKGESEE